MRISYRILYTYTLREIWERAYAMIAKSREKKADVKCEHVGV